MEIQSLLYNDFDPGPEDPSVLVWQHEHRSAAIWEDKDPPRELTCRHKLLGMRDWPLDHRVCRHLIDFGLYGVYKVAFIQLDYALITALVERWRPETHTFHLPVGEVTITLQDVNVLLGLRVDGPAVTGSTKYQWADLCEDLLGLRPGPKDLHGSHVSLGWLRDNFRNLPHDADELTLQRYTRAFVLALMSGFLYGDKSKHDVALTFLPLLRDFDEVSRLSWGSATVALLYRELCRASKRTVSTICGPLVLLQLWAWERLHVGRPGRLKDASGSLIEGIDGPLPDPLGCRWRASLSHKENPRGGLDFYRDQFDQQKEDQVIWQPYTEDILAKLPPICLSGQNIWRTVAPLICFDVVEWHRPDRVLRQFGFHQVIPMPCDNEKALHAIDKRGKSEYDWSARHSRHIELWEARESTVVTGEPGNCQIDYHDPYMEWYRRITRKIISPLKERRPGQFQPTGFAVQLLMRRIAAIHSRCKATLEDELSVDSARLTLQEIHDMCAGLLQITVPLSLTNGSPQAQSLDTLLALPQPSDCDLILPLALQSSQGVEASVASPVQSTAQLSSETHNPTQSLAADENGPLEEVPSFQGLETDNSLSSSGQKPLSWPSGGKLTFSWICDVMLAFDWASRNLPPAEFSSVLPLAVFEDIILSASKILRKEPNCIRISGNHARVVVVGDIHGHLHDLLFLMQDAGFPDDDQFYVFNGNYVDKGAWGLETFLLLLAWKVFLPDRVYLLRGNHESESCTSSYGFKNEVLTKYGDNGVHVYKKCLDCFKLLPLASVIAGRVFTAHGGLFRSYLSGKQEKSRKRKRGRKKQQDNSESELGAENLSLGSLEELSKAKRCVLDPPTEGSNLVPGDILWSDPSMHEGLCLNKERGIGLLWGPECTKKFLEDNNLKLIIRSNEGPDARERREDFPRMDQGYAKDHEGLITVFSAPDYPQFQGTHERYNNKGAYIVLRIPECEEPEIHSFEAAASRPKVAAYYNYNNADGFVECRTNKSMDSPISIADDKDLVVSPEKLETRSCASEVMEVDDKNGADPADRLEPATVRPVDLKTEKSFHKSLEDSSENMERGTSKDGYSETPVATDKDTVHPAEKLDSGNSEPMETEDRCAADSAENLESRTNQTIDSEAKVDGDELVADAGATVECRTKNANNIEPMAIDDKALDDFDENNKENARDSVSRFANDEGPFDVAGGDRSEATTKKATVSESEATFNTDGFDAGENKDFTTNKTTNSQTGTLPWKTKHSTGATGFGGQKAECTNGGATNSEHELDEDNDGYECADKRECTTNKALDRQAAILHPSEDKKFTTDEAIHSELKVDNGKDGASIECTMTVAIDCEPVFAEAKEGAGLAKKFKVTTAEAKDPVSAPSEAKDSASPTQMCECPHSKTIDSEPRTSECKETSDIAEELECTKNGASDLKPVAADDKAKDSPSGKLDRGIEKVVDLEPFAANNDKAIGEAKGGSLAGSDSESDRKTAVTDF